MSTEYKYYAFISYKHEKKGKFKEDAAWAVSLDKELRSLNIPTQISSDELLKESDDSVDPIYRDTSNLPQTIGGKLHATLEKNLRASKTLILILSKAMIEDQNTGYNSNPNKNKAWIYWEVKTFLRYHDNDWSRVIPVYIDNDEYNRELIKTRIGIEDNYDNIQKPWHDYNKEFDWELNKKLYYMRVACDVASAIFRLDDKSVFWNIKEKAQQTIKAEQEKSKTQKRVLRNILEFLAIIAIVIVALLFHSRSVSYVDKARMALDSGNRREAQVFADKAHRNWPNNKEARELMWAAKDSTKAFLTVNSKVSFDRADSLFAYVERNKIVVIVDADTFEEIERIDAGRADWVELSPNAQMVAIYYGNGVRFYNRKKQAFEASFDAQYLSLDQFLWDDSGDQLLLGSRLLTPSGVYYLGDGGRGNSSTSTFDYSSASFIARDSLLVLVRNKWPKDENLGCRIYVYDLGDKFMESDHDWLLPIKEFDLPKGISNCTLTPHNNVAVAFSSEAVYTYALYRNENDFILEEMHSDATQVPLKQVLFQGREDMAFAIDSEGKGLQYHYDNRIFPRVHYSIFGRNKSLGQLTPIGLSSRDHIMYYLNDGSEINITDGHLYGYSLPNTEPVSNITGCLHKNIYCIEIKEQTWQGVSYRSFLYAGGDGRRIYPQNTTRMLSSKYVVRWTDGLFEERDGNSVTLYGSPCVYNPMTGEQIMHVSILEDKRPEYVNPISYVCRNDYLAVTFELSQGGRIIRTFDLNKGKILKEIQLDTIGSFVTWMDDGSFLFSDNGNLYHTSSDSTGTTSLLCDDYWGMVSEDYQMIDRVVYCDSSFNYYWYSLPDNMIRGLERTGDLNPQGDYYVIDNNSTQLSVIDARSLDTLSVQQLSSNQIPSFSVYDMSGSSYFYADGKDTLRCMDIPSAKVRWSKPVWEPSAYVSGNKYLVVQSTSLYVINIQTGKTVCEFDTEQKRLRLSLSPDEKWLLAGDRLYSISSNQLMGTGIDQNYNSIENEYIVYNDYLLKLPNVISLFD